jgi:hypothetical protein
MVNLLGPLGPEPPPGPGGPNGLIKFALLSVLAKAEPRRPAAGNRRNRCKPTLKPLRHYRGAVESLGRWGPRSAGVVSAPSCNSKFRQKWRFSNATTTYPYGKS